MRARLLLAGFLGSTVVAASQGACTGFYDCLYVPAPGYRVCADLEPVLSVTMAGEPIAIVDPLGQVPFGCTCMHWDTQPLWDLDPLDPKLDPLYEQMHDDAMVACEELAIELDADPLPCFDAKLNEMTASANTEPTQACLFADGDIDDDPDCPPYGEDGVFFTTEGSADEADDTSDTDTGGGDVSIFPDLPKEP